MGRATTKAELLTGSEEKFQELGELIQTLTDKELAATFDFTGMRSKTQAHWSRDKNLRDVLIHLYEWHRLLLDWVCANREGKNRPFLPAPYNWKTYGDMNREFWKKHQNTTLEAAKDMLKHSHREVMALTESLTERELFEKGVYPWVGGSVLGSYFVSNTASHYDWAIKKLKAHRKNCKE